MNSMPQLPFMVEIPPEIALAYRGRPQPPRSLRANPGSMEATVVWSLPQDYRGIDRFRIYQGNENNLVGETDNRTIRQFKIKLSANSTDMVYVCSISRLGKESRKEPIAVSSNSDKYVQSGTTGETSGTSATPPPEWYFDPYGGLLGGRPYGI